MTNTPPKPLKFLHHFFSNRNFIKIAADLAFASHSMRQAFQTKVPTKSNQPPTNP